MSSKPRLPQNRSKRNDASGFPIALLLVLLSTLGFFGLLLMVFPGLAMLALAGAATLAFFAAQYLIWARWLLPLARQVEHRRTDATASDESAVE